VLSKMAFNWVLPGGSDSSSSAFLNTALKSFDKQMTACLMRLNATLRLFQFEVSRLTSFGFRFSMPSNSTCTLACKWTLEQVGRSFQVTSPRLKAYHVARVLNKP